MEDFFMCLFCLLVIIPVSKKRGSKGRQPPLRGSGCPRKTLFLSFSPPQAAKMRGKKTGDTPDPGLTSRYIFGTSLSAGLSRAAALGLGFGAAPQLPFFPVLRRRRRRATSEKRSRPGRSLAEVARSLYLCKLVRPRQGGPCTSFQRYLNSYVCRWPV